MSNDGRIREDRNYVTAFYDMRFSCRHVLIAASLAIEADGFLPSMKTIRLSHPGSSQQHYVQHGDAPISGGVRDDLIFIV